MNEKSDELKYLNKSLYKALKLVDCFKYGSTKMTATELANKMDTKPGTLYPTLFTLEHLGYLERDGDKKYSLGLNFLEKGRMVLDNLDLRTKAHPELEKLRDRTNESVHLGILDEGEIVYIDKIESQRSFRMYSSVGKRVAVHATSLGKAILAYLPEDEVKNILELKGLPRFTENTITSLTKLLQELDRVRKQGYSVDNAEHEELIRCIGSPIFNHAKEPVGAVSVTVLASRMDWEKLKELAPLVKECAQTSSKNLGYQGDK